MTSTTVKVTIELELDVSGTIEKAQPSVGAERCVGDWHIQAIRDPTDKFPIVDRTTLKTIIHGQCRDQIEEALFNADA